MGDGGGGSLGFPQLLIWAKYTHRTGPAQRELSISAGNKCHSGATALYRYYAPNPTTKEGQISNLKIENNLIGCKLILWSFYITFAKNMHLFLLRCKKICLSVLLTNQIKCLDKGLTVRTSFQISKLHL